ncbi:MAG: hypothetical protein H7Y28_07110 [Rhodoferax sp.]|nr:hypothetical protein [Rhodoferax sp.]
MTVLPSAASVSLRQQLGVYVGYLLVLLFLFGGLAFSGRPQVIGSPGSELNDLFLAWRSWGFAQMAEGQLPLWNPHVFAGAPFIGGFQSALFYPPNWAFMVLPLHIAVNTSVMLHMLLLAGLMFHWAVAKGMRAGPAALSGLVAMLGGSFFLHVYAGHMSNLSAMAWIPLILRAVEMVVAQARTPESGQDLHWSLVGALAVCMQILAGHPQYVYFTAMAICLYLVLNWNVLYARPHTLLPLLLIPTLALVLAAVQLLPSLQATAETIRAKPLPYEFASKFGFPPENLLTALLPNLFGDHAGERYLGRAYLWEMSIFVGATVLFLVGTASAAACRPVSRTTQAELWQYPVLIGLLTVLAMGAKTPLYQWMFDYLPGYSKFRGTSKFMVFCNVYVAMLAGFGLQRLLSGQDVIGRWTAPMVAVLGLALLLLALSTDVTTVEPVLLWIAQTQESYALAPLAWSDTPPTELQRIALHAANVAKTAFALGAATLLLLALLLQLAHRRPSWAWALGLLAALELMLFARSAVTFFPIQDPATQPLTAFFKAMPNDHRSANLHQPNHSMLYGGYDVSGADPGITLRYAQLMHFLQGSTPDDANQYLGFARWQPPYDMLRLGYLLRMIPQGDMEIVKVGNPMPTATLVGGYRVIAERDAMFSAIAQPHFDPRSTVLLSGTPAVLPQAGVQGTVKVLTQGGDAITLEAELDRPAILLVTDLYTPSWKVKSLPGSSQTEYELLPANYVLRAVPLQAGHHRLKIYYDRTWLHAGMALSAGGLLVWLLLWSQRRRPSAAGA